MKILLLGRNGQVGWELLRALAPLGEVVAPDRGTPQGRWADLSRPEQLAAGVREVAPQVIVNAAAYTAVDRAEGERELADLVNAAAPAALAREAAALGAWLVHYSTDYVFDGGGTEPWTEESPTGPLNVYGRSKLDGERAIRDSACRHLIFRTSWLYAARGQNFARTMLKLARDRDQLSVVDDQIGAPTGAELVADVTAHALRSCMMNSAAAGTYHLAAAGAVSWHGYARHVIEFARASRQPIKVSNAAIAAVSSETFRTAATRPQNSRLDTTRLRNTFGLHLPNWQDGVERMLTELFSDQPGSQLFSSL